MLLKHREKEIGREREIERERGREMGYLHRAGYLTNLHLVFPFHDLLDINTTFYLHR